MSLKGKTVRHCHGKKKGQIIKRHKTKAAAQRHHRAITRKKR